LGCPELRPPGGDFDHFTRLGLARAFAIDPAELERNYLMLARGLHPDQFARRTAQDRALAERLSAELNESYRLLRDPIARAEYLLSLEGGPSREQDKRTPGDFLVEMLETNEKIEEAEADMNPAARAELERLRAELRRRNDEVIAALPGDFTRLGGADPAARAEVLRGVRERLNVSAYLRGLLTQISELLLR
jgi:molecular chaperone HscB